MHNGSLIASALQGTFTGASSFKESLQMGAEVYHSLKSVVKKRYGKDAAAVGDEGDGASEVAMGRRGRVA